MVTLKNVAIEGSCVDTFSLHALEGTEDVALKLFKSDDPEFRKALGMAFNAGKRQHARLLCDGGFRLAIQRATRGESLIVFGEKEDDGGAVVFERPFEEDDDVNGVNGVFFIDPARREIIFALVERGIPQGAVFFVDEMPSEGDGEAAGA